MKKGLLSILAGALVVVGCQNYDDQFDNLESQISALASTVAGLSQVQSDLASLAQTVSNLQTGLQSTIDTALADSLSDIETAVASLEAATEGAASPEDVQAIADAVADQEDDLAQILANSSVFTGTVTIKSVAQLDAMYALKGTLAIVNGSVDIVTNDDMDKVKLQEILDVIVTVTEDFSYVSDDSDWTAAFPKLSGTRSLTIDMEGNVVMPSLANATIVEIDEDSSTAVVDLESLASVTSLSNGDGAGTFKFAKATNVHLTALAAYNGNLTIEVDEGGTILLDALRDVDSDGDATGDDLTIIGPTSFTVSALDGTGSTLTLRNVVNATVNSYNGTIVTDTGVENFSADNVVSWTVSGTDLVSVDVTGALDSDADADDTDGPAISLSNQSDLLTVDIDGVTEDITISTNGNMTGVTIGGTVSSTIDINGNTDLETLDVSAATASTIDIDNNSDLETLVVDATITASSTGTIIVKDNESLTDLTISTNDVGVLTITGNLDLTTINATSLNSIGVIRAADVTISGNDLTASKVDADNSSIATDSGMDTLSSYLTAVVADSDSTANVVFDTVDTYIDADGNDDGEFTSGDQVIVLKIQPADITAGKDAQAHKNSYILNASAGQGLHLDIDGTDIFDTNENNVDAAGNYTFQGNQVLDLAAITAAANTTRALSTGVVMTAQAGGFSTITVTFEIVNVDTDSTTLLGERYGSTSALAAVESATTGSITQTLGTDDYVTFTVGSNSVTATGVDSDTLADNIIAAWTAKYSSSGKASGSTVFTITQDASTAGSLYVTSNKRGSASHNADVTVSVTASSTGDTGTTGAAVEFTIGGTISQSDNATDSDNIILTLEAQDTPPLADPLDQASLTISSNVVTTLTTTLRVNSDPAAEQKYYDAVTEDRDDCALPESGSIDVVNSAAVNKTKVAWL